MASTNKTENVNLSQFLASDKPAWLTDYNNDMQAIDTAVGGKADKGPAVTKTLWEGTLEIGGSVVIPGIGKYSQLAFRTSYNNQAILVPRYGSTTYRGGGFSTGTSGIGVITFNVAVVNATGTVTLERMNYCALKSGNTVDEWSSTGGTITAIYGYSNE